MHDQLTKIQPHFVSPADGRVSECGHINDDRLLQAKVTSSA